MAKALPKDPVFYDIGGIFLQETEDAILLEVDGDSIWLPKSQIEYDESTERGDYMEVAVPDWLCDQKGLDDGDGIGKKTLAEPAPEPVAYTEDDIVSFELFIENIIDDGTLIVEPTSRYDKDKKEFVPVEKTDATYELRTDVFTTEDEIRVGAIITAEISARAAVEAGLIPPPRLFGENSTWLKKDVIPYSFDLTDKEKIELADKMATAQGKISRLEEELAETRKALKGEIDMLQADLKEAARIFKSGKADPVPVKCDVIQDWTTDELVWVSADEEARELQRRKMTPEEKQPSLFREPPK